jgi:UrcA family protein
MMTSRILPAIVIAIVMWLGFLQADAAAQSRPSLSQVVTFDDLDLNSPNDARVLVLRINRVARSVCGATSGSVVALVRFSDTRACARDAARNAVQNLNHPVVTAAFERRNPVRVAQAETNGVASSTSEPAAAAVNASRFASRSKQ